MTPGSAQSAAQGKSIQYSVSGLDNGTDYTVDLFNCDNVSTDANGQVSFVQTTQPTSTQAGSGVADEGARGNNGISVVNGVATSQSSSYPKSTTVKPSNGTITFTVSNTDTSAPESCVVPVVFQDANQSGTLNVDKTSGQPTEAFGDGGSATFTPPAATSGSYTISQVLSVDKSAGTFVGTATGANAGTYSFSYTAAGDNYSYSLGGTRLSESQFADYLSAKMATAGVNDGTVKGDALTVNYNASGPSDFTYTTDVPAAPTGTKAAFDAAVTSGPNSSQHADRVTVTWTAPSNPDVDGYNVYRADVDNKGNVGAFTQVGSTVDPTATPVSSSSTSGGTTFYDTTVMPGHTYAYEVSALAGAVEGPVSNQDQATDPAASQPGAVAGAPTISDVRAQDNGSAFQVDTGDIIQMVFNEPMASNSLQNASFRLSDGVNAGTLVLDGTHATYAWLPAGTYNGVKVLDHQAAQIVVGSGLANPTTGAVTYPANITKVTSGVVDSDEGKVLDLTKGDTTINTDQSFTAVDTTAPTESNPTATAAGTVGGGNATVEGTVTASDNVAVTAVKATLQDGTGAAVATADATYDSTSGTWKVSFPVTTAGSYTVQYVAKDAAGNTSAPATSTAATVS